MKTKQKSSATARHSVNSRISPVLADDTTGGGKQIFASHEGSSPRPRKKSDVANVGVKRKLTIVPSDPNQAGEGIHGFEGNEEQVLTSTNSSNGGQHTRECSDSPDPIAALRELQCQRVILMRSSQRLVNQSKAYVRRMLGWHGGLTEKESTAIASKAGDIVKTIEAGEAMMRVDTKSVPDPLVSSVAPMVLKLFEARSPIDNAVTHIESSMVKLAKQLPVAEFVESTLGLGLKGLAAIVGEAGDIGKFSIRGLRKYMGLAPFEGKACSTWRISKPSLSAEQWTQAGYCPRRMAILYQIAESAGVKCTRSEYRRIYDESKARESTRTDKPIVAHRRAMRKVASRVLIDLQVEWSKATGVPLPTRKDR